MARPPKSVTAPDGCLSIPDYARLAEVTRAAVVKAIKAGRLKDSVVDADGFTWVRPEVADREWAANTQQREQASKRSYRKTEVVTQATQRELSDKPKVGEADRQPAGEETDYFEARRRRELYTAELKRLELQEREGQLVKITDVADTVETEYARLRQRLLAIPGKAGQEVIGVEDAAEAARVIDAYIVEALTELSEGRSYAD
jgi:hypothetical protein